MDGALEPDVETQDKLLFLMDIKIFYWNWLQINFLVHIL